MPSKKALPDDQRGRLYPLAIGASKLSRHYRALLFGRSHTEIDITGSHYQFFQRFAFSLLNISLPPVDQLRDLLKEDFLASNSRFLEHHPTSPKDLPTILLNSSLDATLLYYRGKGYWPSPTPDLSNQTSTPCGSQFLLRATYPVLPHIFEPLLPYHGTPRDPLAQVFYLLYLVPSLDL